MFWFKLWHRIKSAFNRRDKAKRLPLTEEEYIYLLMKRYHAPVEYKYRWIITKPKLMPLPKSDRGTAIK